MSILSSIPLNPTSYRGGAGFWMFNQEGKDLYFTYNGIRSAVTAYEACPPVAAIINRKAQAYINGRTWLLNEKGKEATSGKAGRIRKLMAKPNPLQSWKQFEAQGYIYQQLFGYNVVLPIRPVGFDNSYATRLWNLPANMLKIVEKESFELSGKESSVKDYIKSITFVYGTTRTPLDLDAVYIFKDFVPSFKSLVIPGNRVQANEMVINNIIGAYESRNVLIHRRGPQNVFSSQGTDEIGSGTMSHQEKLELQEEFKRYGLLRGQWQQILTTAAIKVQPVGFSTKELLLFEEIEDDILRLCDGWNYPQYLLGSAKGTTFENLKEAKKLLYQDGVIPEAENQDEQWTQFWELHKEAEKSSKDYSHIPALQADKVQEATARKTLNEALKIEYEQGLINLDQWLEKLGEDPLPNGMGQVRATDPKTSSVPLAVSIGVGGVQSLISVLTASGMSEEARRSTLEILFGIDPKDAARMAAGSGQEQGSGSGESGNNNGNQNANNNQ